MEATKFNYCEMKKDNEKIKRALNADIPTWDENEVWAGIESSLPPQQHWIS